MPTTVIEWELDVQRGPGWLLVRPTSPTQHVVEHFPLADRLWSLLERHFIYRLVLELDEVPALNSHLIGQLLLLYRHCALLVFGAGK